MLTICIVRNNEVDRLECANKVFIDIKGYSRYFKSGMIILGIPACLAIIGILLIDWRNSNIELYIVPIISCIAIIYAFISQIIGANTAIYSLYNGRLYKINLPNQAARDANAARGLGDMLGDSQGGMLAAGAVLAGEGSLRDKQLNRLASDSNYLERELEKDYSLEILQVLSMKPFKGGYKIKVQCKTPNSGKIHNKFYLFPGYNDYEKLVDCLESLK